jgi:hypothetical protein
VSRIATLGLIGTLCALPAAAEEASRQLGAHEHGHGTFNMAVEGNRVLIELEAPGADIVGFEHPAESAEDKAAIEQAEAVLSKPLALFVVPAAAGCSVDSVDIDLVGEAHHEHGEKHAEEHAEHEGDAHAEQEGHNEFHVAYALTCTQPDALGSVNFVYFDKFPNAQELDVSVITERGQSAYEVERSARVIDLKGLI